MQLPRAQKDDSLTLLRPTGQGALPTPGIHQELRHPLSQYIYDSLGHGYTHIVQTFFRQGTEITGFGYFLGASRQKNNQTPSLPPLAE
jgi:hypothetical protein